jgi:hypothetical protein
VFGWANIREIEAAKRDFFNPPPAPVIPVLTPSPFH